MRIFEFTRIDRYNMHNNYILNLSYNIIMCDLLFPYSTNYWYLVKTKYHIDIAILLFISYTSNEYNNS